MSTSTQIRCDGEIVIPVEGKPTPFGRCSHTFTDPTAQSWLHAREHAEDAGWFATPARDLCPGHRRQAERESAA